MRISLLLEREPFAEILARSLERYWHEQFAREFSVRLTPGKSAVQSSLQSTPQQWVCNNLLNAIFLPGIQSDALDPIRKEFSRSPSVWKRPFQRIYVSLATGAMSSRLRHATLEVTPPVPDADDLVIIPGNRKVRILEHARQRATCILKEGFAPAAFHVEIDARQNATSLGIAVPELIEVNREQGWFRESYLSGQPLNRLADRQEVVAKRKVAFSDIRRLVEATLEPATAEDYAKSLEARIVSGLDEASQINPHNRQYLQQGVQHLRQSILEATNCPRELSISETHGDFQPANVLVADSGCWIIDWENAGRRQSVYDLLVMTTNSRMSIGLADRLAQVVKSDVAPASESDWPGLDWSTTATRTRHADLFFLEEVAWHVAENTNTIFTSESSGLNQIVAELEVWLQNRETTIRT